MQCSWVRAGWVGLVSLMAGCGSAVADEASRYLDQPVARHFDFPVGPPDGQGYYNAQGFGENFHLGEDWNGLGGGDTDLGDPVHAIGKGRVVAAAHAGAGWGKTVRVVHHLRRHGRDALVESVYAHLDVMTVEEGAWVERGQQIGTIGDADGRYVPHLHFEVRSVIGRPLGPGYAREDAGFLNPTAFIEENRPPPHVAQRDTDRRR